MKRTIAAGLLLTFIAFPASAGAQTSHRVPSLLPLQRQFVIVATVQCERSAKNASVCDGLLGPLSSMRMDATIRWNASSPQFTYTASYAASRSGGTGNAVCSFGLSLSHLRRVYHSHGSTCHVNESGIMTLRRGVTGGYDFWVTGERAVVSDVPKKWATIISPLGKRAYPVDTRVPVIPCCEVVRDFSGAQYLHMIHVLKNGQPMPPGMSVHLKISSGMLVG